LIANEVARELILHSPTNTEIQQFQDRRQFVEQQMSDLQVKIQSAQARITDLNKSLNEAFSARQIQDLQSQINVLQAQVTSWQANYAQLLTSSPTTSPNYLTIMEPAQVPVTPISPRVPTNVALAAVVGLILAVGAALLLEYLDDTIKSADDVESALQLTPLGSIARMQGGGYQGKLIAMEQPRSPIAEAFRTIRTNLQYSTLDKPVKTLLVTSSVPVEGKSVAAANLAVVLAQAGLRTLLIDADLRRPSAHKLFRLPNQSGLSNALLRDGASANGHLQMTETENLRVLTSGPIPPNPSELLGSRKMQELLDRLKTEQDVIVLDSSPVLAVTDSSVLATQVDGVVLVTQAGSTRRQAALRSRDTLRKVGGNIVGAIVNRIPRGAGSGYYYQYYYSGTGDKRNKKRKLAYKV
jgi:succinoglycan biosynthesis transport protein ExoP